MKLWSCTFRTPWHNFRLDLHKTLHPCLTLPPLSYRRRPSVMKIIRHCTRLYQGLQHPSTAMPGLAQPFFAICHELAVIEGLVLFCARIVVSSLLQKLVLERLHFSYMGATHTKQRACQTVCWPSISIEVNNVVANCPSCIQFAPSNPKEPLHQIPPAAAPFMEVFADFSAERRPS